MFIVAVLIASAAWFLVAAILFFNPIVDKVYRSEEAHPAVEALPQTPSTIGKILLAILVQSLAWAFIYTQIAPAIGGGYVRKGLIFGVILILMKMVPRDIDRLLLSTYPVKRMTIEFVIGVICSFVVSLVFAYFL